jgi:hypothetical protein
MIVYKITLGVIQHYDEYTTITKHSTNDAEHAAY